ncbi:NUDIX domain-containing protein [Brachybacterium squillarum]|uniref:NUDIX domain-containing protein n=1 Tax=Brachybacterium squillarum TaxID=661979 RepID=UPI000262983F|nr:NUDIX hydrolase [Brachybacterium squillarum]
MPSLLPDPAYFATLPKVMAFSAVILRDETGRVLVEDPNYRDHWLLPGGGVDPGEDPRQAAQREVREELGLDIEVGRLLTIYWVGSRVEIGAPMGMHLIFDGGVIPRAELEARVVPQEAELDDWALIEESELEILSPWGAERVRHALAVLRGEEQPDLYTTPGRR